MMSTRVRCALPAFSILFALSPADASSRQAGRPVDQSVAIGHQAADEARIPVNLAVIPTLRPVVDKMWHQSPTFKCAVCAPETNAVTSRERSLRQCVAARRG